MSAKLDVELKKRATVLWYNRGKGHGWLAVDGYPSDLYVHAAEVRKAGLDPDKLLQGTPLLCNVATHDGRPVAADLEFAP